MFSSVYYGCPYTQWTAWWFPDLHQREMHALVHGDRGKNVHSPTAQTSSRNEPKCASTAAYINILLGWPHTKNELLLHATGSFSKTHIFE